MINFSEQSDDLALISDVYAAIEDTNKIRIRESILTIHKQNTKPKVIFLNNLRNRSIAAAIASIVVVGGSVITYHFSSSNSNQDIYSENFNPNIDIAQIRSDTNLQVSDAVTNGILYFQNKEYNIALEIFKTDTISIMAKLYSGFCYMQLEKFDSAIQEFHFIVLDDNNLFIDQAEWNLGLCYLKTNKIVFAIEIFNKIKTGQGFYSKKASNILNELNKENN